MSTKEVESVINKEYKAKELPALLGVSIASVYNLLNTGALPYTIPAGRKTRDRVVSQSAIKAYYENQLAILTERSKKIGGS